MSLQSNIGRVVGTCVDTGCRKATLYLGEDYTIKVSRRHKPDRRNSREEFLVTIGAPNYDECQFIKECKKAGEKFPVQKIQLKWYPKGKSKCR